MQLYLEAVTTDLNVRQEHLTTRRNFIAMKVMGANHNNYFAVRTTIVSNMSQQLTISEPALDLIPINEIKRMFADLSMDDLKRIPVIQIKRLNGDCHRGVGQLNRNQSPAFPTLV